MLDIESMFGSEHDLSNPIVKAISDLGVLAYMTESASGKQLSEDAETSAFFAFLVRAGGTAVDFDWIRGHNFCALEDWHFFEEAEGSQ